MYGTPPPTPPPTLLLKLTLHLSLLFSPTQIDTSASSSRPAQQRLSSMASKFVCYFEVLLQYISRPLFFHPSDCFLVEEAAKLKSPPRPSELPRAIFRGYRLCTKKNYNMVLVEDKSADGLRGDRVASGCVYYFRSYKKECKLGWLKGEDFNMTGSYVHWLYEWGVESQEWLVSTQVARKGWELVSTASTYRLTSGGFCVREVVDRHIGTVC